MMVINIQITTKRMDTQTRLSLWPHFLSGLCLACSLINLRYLGINNGQIDMIFAKLVKIDRVVQCIQTKIHTGTGIHFYIFF